ncbi:aspartoacylase [Nematostella vectensis]|uniref:aspartoacylase n=1 Tax=Nematostella vectensis TaxID=45351 RepID=UPI0020776223|nr:aspartoacylase [Nematostella vectensis]
MTQPTAFSNVLVVGGTHGNELTGVYLVKHWQKQPKLVERSSFKTHLCLGNTKAVEKCVRYIDKDLNRERFDRFEKDTKECTHYETKRKQELISWMALEQIDFVIDLHNTTSNMGVTLILRSIESILLLHLVGEVQEKMPFPVHILVLPDRPKKSFSGDSATGGWSLYTEFSIGIEVGPISHGTLKGETIQKQEKVLQAFLDSVEKHNATKTYPKRSIQVFKWVEAVHYPLDELEEVTAFVHPALDSQDWEPLRPGSPMLMTFEGDTVYYQGKEIVYPVFINEAAYFDVKKNIAFAMTRKMSIDLPELDKTT